MSTRENIRLIARAPLISLFLCEDAWRKLGYLHASLTCLCFEQRLACKKYSSSQVA